MLSHFRNLFYVFLLRDMTKSPERLGTDMTQGSILPQIVRFALPLLTGNIFQQLYNTMDCLIVGRFLGRDALAAVGSAGQLVFGVIGFFNGLATGAQVIISQSFGAKDRAALKAAVHTSVLASLFISVFLSFFGIFISNFMLRLIRVPAAVFELASSYLRIFFSGMVFLILYDIGSGILRALGDSKRPLYFLIFSSVINIVLDLVFVLVLKMGIRGAAFATVISEMLSVVPVFWVLCTVDGDYKVRLRDLRVSSPILAKILKIGLPGAVSSALIALSNTFMQKYVNVFGEACIAGFAVFSRFDNFIIMPMVSISFAITTFVSQNFGANEFARIRKGVKLSFVLNLCLIGAISFLAFLFARCFTMLFISDAESVRYGSLFIRFATPFYVLCATTMLYCQALHGLGESLAPTAIILGGFVVLRQTYLFMSTHLSGRFAFVALAYPIVWVFTALVMVLYYRRALERYTRR